MILRTCSKLVNLVEHSCSGGSLTLASRAEPAELRVDTGGATEQGGLSRRVAEERGPSTTAVGIGNLFSK